MGMIIMTVIYSEEENTQGDVAAMGMYGIATRPLINELPNIVNKKDCKQVWYADDSTACGKLRGEEMEDHIMPNNSKLRLLSPSN